MIHWFVIAFFAVSFLVYGYLYFTKVRPIVKSPFLRLLLISLILIAIPFPVWVRIADRYLDPSTSKIIAFILLSWLGFIIYLFFFCLIFDILSLLFKLLFRRRLFNPKKIFFFSFILSLLFSIYSYTETLGLEVIKLEFRTDKLPPQVKKIKILHISDLHLGPLLGEEKIHLIKTVWEKETPDIIVNTGDLVDGNMRNRYHLAQMLSSLTAPLGKYAVLGNHEYYRGWKEASAFIEKAGFILLRNQAIKLNEGLIIIGLDDEDCKYARACVPDFDIDRFLNNLNTKNSFILVLKHQPKIKREMIGKFDLMLSGHTHGGLYRYVGSFVVRLFYETNKGLKYLGNGSYLFVSKGVGTGGPPMRFLSPPDVAIIEIINQR